MYGYKFRGAADILSAALGARRPMGPGPYSILHRPPEWRWPPILGSRSQYGTWDLKEAIRIAAKLARRGGLVDIVSDEATPFKESRVLSIWPSSYNEGLLQAQLTD